jgi:hypothetical protein
VRGNLRVAGSYFVRAQQDNRPCRAAKVHHVEEDEVIKALLGKAPDQTLRGPAGNDYMTPKAEGRTTAAKDFASAFGFRASFGLRTSAFGLQLFRQPNPESVIRVIHIPEAHQADPALEELLELFAEVGHQISSPSFLICA